MSTENKAEDRQAPQTLGYLQSKRIQFDYTWKIGYKEFGVQYESPIFSPECNEKLKFYLSLKDIGYEYSHKVLYLSLLPCNVSEMAIGYVLHVVQLDGSKTQISKGNSTCTSLSPTEETEIQLLDMDCEYSFTLHQDYLSRSTTIFCEFDLVVKEFCVPVIKTTLMKPPECDLHYDMGHLLEDQHFTDVTVEVCELKLPAHKAILSARSPVFSAMFKHDMAEKQQNRVEVTDVEPEVMKELLRYIYTGQVPLIKTLAHKLLMAAEKYQLERLKLMCEETLATNLTPENATNTLILAELLNSIQLKTFVIEYIAQNMVEVMETASFKTMLKNHPYLGLMAEIIKCQIEEKVQSPKNP